MFVMRGRRVLLAVPVCLGLLAAIAPAAVAAPATTAPDSPLVRVIVRLQPGGDVDAQLSRATAVGARKRFLYRNVIRGFAVEVPERALSALARLPQVVAVERDTPMQAVGTETTSAWGLDRIDQAALPLSGTYSYPDDEAGKDVTAYVLDTGILASHADFGGRVRSGFTAVNDGNGTSDCNGHGTHVAGTIAGATYGVAKKAVPVAVRVLDCSGSGSTSGVIAGLDWVVGQHAEGAPAVANLSLGGGVNTSLDTAVENLIKDGVTVTLAAGNSNATACTRSPSRVPAALTVAASTRTDSRASFSNFGSCTDLFAPGDGIVSDWYTGPSATKTLSGTSMAAPHVAGAAALVLRKSGYLPPDQVANRLLTAATPNVIADAGSGSPNRLLRVDAAAAPVVPPPPAPVGCAGQKIVNPGFESGATGWKGSTGVIGQPGAAGSTHGGTWNARLGGAVGKITRTLTQSVQIPTGCTTYRLGFWLRVDTTETTTSRDDELEIEFGSSTLAEYSNRDRGATYVERTFTVSRQAKAGRVVTLTFEAAEDRDRPTTFSIDDVTLTAS